MSTGDSEEEEVAPPVARPKKNFGLFITNDNEAFFPKGIFDQGEMGQLPIFMSVNVGYDPEDPDPFMYHYESQELLFAYKKGRQQRVLIQDSHQRTLSLPVQSPVKFKLRFGSTEEQTISELLCHQLPVSVEFARPETIDFEVDRHLTNHTFFGPLRLIQLYDEPFYYCLPVQGCGTINESKAPIVLPRNLKDVCFSHVVGVKGVNDPSAVLKEFVAKYSDTAKKLRCDTDPFFQELAIVSKGPDLVFNVEPYIDQNTFVVIHYHRRPAPDTPATPAPSLPPRTPVDSKEASYAALKDWQSKTRSLITETHYTPLQPGSDEDEHIYHEPQSAGMSRGQTLPRPSAVVKNAQTLPSEDVRNAHTVPKPSAEGKSAKLSPLERPPIPPPHSGEKVGGKQPEKVSSKQPEKVSDKQPLVRAASTTLSMKEPGSANVGALTVDQVAERLEQLGMDKHAKKFRKQKIDGVLLTKLTMASLKKDFKMSETDLIKLNAFISTGHVPR